MNLDELLLCDYGSVPKKIGMFLLRKNASSLEAAQKGSRLSERELRDGLIQRRLVKFFIFERTVKYYADRNMLRRRLYFPIYMHHVAEYYSSAHLKLFTRVLACGTIRMPDDAGSASELLSAGVLQNDATLSGAERHSGARDGACEQSPKKRRTTASYLAADFNHLDQRIFEMVTATFLARKYNEAAAEVYRAALKCDHINKTSVIKNLNTTKILLLDNGAVVNDRNNIADYLRYLCSSQVLCQGADSDRAYVINNNTPRLKTYRISLMIGDPACRRLFNMVGHSTETDDRALTVGTLLSVNKIKESVLYMQRNGLLQQRCIDEYKGAHRVEHSWAVDLDFASRQIIKKLEAAICGRLEQLNECWDVNYYMEGADGNDSVWMSDLINLSMDHLILSLD